MVGYHGGKVRSGYKIALAITKEINRQDKAYNAYIEPFCGMCGVFRYIPELTNRCFKYIAGDIHPSLITMWQELQNGWKPPTTITEKRYEQLKKYKDIPSAIGAYIGFGCSWGGIYYSKYQYDNSPHNLTNIAIDLTKQSNELKDVTFVNCEYTKFVRITNCIIYCDPPYDCKHTNYEQLDGTTRFDNTMFNDWCSTLAEHNLVFVSCYTKPIGVRCKKIIEITTNQTVKGNIVPNECLYRILTKQKKKTS